MRARLLAAERDVRQLLDRLDETTEIGSRLTIIAALDLATDACLETRNLWRLAERYATFYEKPRRLR